MHMRKLSTVIPTRSAPPKVVVILGSTAVGKTALSIAIAKAIGGEVISADSRQVYRGLTIGTGKITKQEMQKIPHHLLDVENPNKTFTAADYVRLGRAAISEIAARGKVPIVVGGTGFYIDALFGRMRLAGVPPNPALRAQLSAFSLEKLNTLLKKLDPERYKTIEQKNRVRVVRAIEIAKAGSVKNQNPEPQNFYPVLWIGLMLPQQILQQKIHTRLFARIRGIEREVKNLQKKGLSWKRMEELGLEYRYMARYLQKKISREDMLTQLEMEIRKYTKRQWRWFKRNKEIAWLAPNQKKEILSFIKKFLA